MREVTDGPSTATSDTRGRSFRSTALAAGWYPLVAVAAILATGLLWAPRAGADTAKFTLQPGPLLDPLPQFLQTTDPPEADLPGATSSGSLVLPSPFTFERTPFPRRLGTDLAAIAQAPLVWEGADWRKLGLGVLAVGATSLLDEEINSWLDVNRSRSAVRVAKTIRPLGQEVCLAALGATWLAGKGFDRPDLTAIAEDGFEAAIIAAGVITPALKAIAGRARPRFSADSDAFGAAGQSFPSGETTLAFAVASVVAAHSEKTWVDVAAWSAASLIGLQRMTLDAHWASDVVAGALIGSAVGHWVVRRNHPERGWRSRVAIAPIIEQDRIGVSLRVGIP